MTAFRRIVSVWKWVGALLHDFHAKYQENISIFHSLPPAEFYFYEVKTSDRCENMSVDPLPPDAPLRDFPRRRRGEGEALDAIGSLL